jgi:hypothetical protein
MVRIMKMKYSRFPGFSKDLLSKKFSAQFFFRLVFRFAFIFCYTRISKLNSGQTEVAEPVWKTYINKDFFSPCVYS